VERGGRGKTFKSGGVAAAGQEKGNLMGGGKKGNTLKGATGKLESQDSCRDGTTFSLKTFKSERRTVVKKRSAFLKTNDQRNSPVMGSTTKKKARRVRFCLGLSGRGFRGGNGRGSMKTLNKVLGGGEMKKVTRSRGGNM